MPGITADWRYGIGSRDCSFYIAIGSGYFVVKVAIGVSFAVLWGDVSHSFRGGH